MVREEATEVRGRQVVYDTRAREVEKNLYYIMHHIIIYYNMVYTIGLVKCMIKRRHKSYYGPASKFAELAVRLDFFLSPFSEFCLFINNTFGGVRVQNR